MKAQSVKFNVKDNPEFFKVLRSRVNNYFTSNDISQHANTNMRIKTIFMFTLYFAPLIIMLTGAVTSLPVIFLMWFLMGLGMSGIGLSIMHDANHGSYSRNRKINKFLGFSLNFIGGYPMNWKIQHNVLHHSFTNVHGFDEDIEKKGVIRFSPTQEGKWIYKFQIFYAPFLYAIMTFYWLIGKDFEQLIRYNKRNLLKAQGISFKRALVEILFHKTWYLAITLIIPMMVIPIAWWQTLLGFLMMHVMCGLILAFIFQMAHVIEETEFYEVDDKGSVENNWAIHQLNTTANFANDSVVFSWLIGGLNYQIEHHLFPNICHVHYRNIAGIVKQTAQEFGVPYHQHKTFMHAIRSHFKLLYHLGGSKPQLT